MSNQTIKFNIIDSEIRALSARPGFENAQKVINAVVGLFDLENTEWKLFNDSQGKIRSNATWFMEAQGFSDRRATYKIADSNSKNIDFKAYWTKNTSKSIISWLVALTPNFEDEDFDLGDKVGIDFIIPEDADRVIVALSNRFIVRTLELSESLSITEQEIFAKWQQDFDFSNKAQFHELLWNSFDFEPVNKKFFKEISAFFTELRQYLSEDIKIFDEKHAAYFTNRLIGRIVFCWFLDKKGIINPEMNYFEVEEKTATDYYRQKLEILFFKVLNTPIDERGDGIEKITPFLNGGLFEVKNNDKFGEAELKFPADYFDRFFKFLRHYNFTTDESTSTFQQVAIDPEMLGRIFENLLAEQTEETGQQARKAKGAFYTPREIVDYMCRESLREYLKTKTEATDELGQKIDQLLDSKPHEWRDQQKNYRDKLKADKYNILQALDEIKVLDPACGSGAFPMGMLHLLLQTYERIDSTFDSYKKKLNIIKNSLFGVDIEPMAVEISRLRAWLSIIVDEESDSKKIEPLPNLDFKFICANSLIPLDGSGVKKLDGDMVGLEEVMQEIRDKYFNARTQKSKKEYRNKFEKIYIEANRNSLFGRSKRHEQLSSYHPFDSENVINFFDSTFIFGEDSFDIVIGNPPYVEFKNLDKNIKTEIQKYFTTIKGKYDLYIPFCEKGLDLIGGKGILTFIMPTRFMFRDYGKTLREYLINKARVKSIVDFSDFQAFETALAYTGIFQFTKKIETNNEFNYKKIKSTENHPSILKYLDAKTSISGVDIVKVKHEQLNGGPWYVQNNINEKILDKIKNESTLLTDICEGIYQGIATGKDEVFIIAKDKKEKFKIEDEVVKPFLKGKDISRYCVNWKNTFLIYPYNSEGKVYEEEIMKNKYPNCYNYLCDQKGLLTGRGYFEKSSKLWYELWNQRNLNKFQKTKIITLDNASKNTFALDYNNFLGTTTTYSIVLKNNQNVDYRYLLSLLNSRLLTFYHQNNTIPQAGGFYRYQALFIKQMPIKIISSDLQKPFIEKVDKILKILASNSNGCSELEKEIDQLVYSIYGLTEEEIKIVESYV